MRNRQPEPANRNDQVEPPLIESLIELLDGRPVLPVAQQT
jgi:hypothetical protein